MSDILQSLELLRLQVATIWTRQAVTDGEAEKLFKSAKRRKLSLDAVAVELDGLTEWRRDLAEDLRCAYQLGTDRGLQLVALLRFAEALSVAIDSWEALKIDALADLERLRVAIGQATGDTEESARKRRGLQLWNDGDKWTDVAEQLDGTPEFWRSVQQEIRRFAKSNNLPIRTGKSGAKRLS